MADPYISRKTVNSSYRPKGNVMSPGLKRAREPFRFRNAITGVMLASFAAGVWAYSISAVKQDDFADIDEEARVLAGSRAINTEQEIRDKGTVESATGSAVLGITPTAPASPLSTSPAVPEDRQSGGRGKPRGVLATLLHERYPRLLDPTNNTLVWGAPPVDRVGRMKDGNSTTQK